MLLNETIKNNIIYGIERDITQEELDEAAKKAYLYDFIISLPEKYDTFIGDRGVKLSGGEKQRLAIARAMIKDTDILILDEATSALDSETEMLIQKAIKNLTQGKTVLAIAHRLSTIKGADSILVLEKGEITEQGSSDELLARKGKFFYYWNLQKFF
jgi:ABC-type multidrug transport system fused ATPase/permease subunit